MTNSRQVASSMAFVAATLAVASALHLTGALSDGGGSSGAGIPEAVICVALAAGSVALFRDPVRGRQPALGTLAFAIFGFIVGLTFTISGGDAADLVYHAVMLPVLVVTLLTLIGSDTVARRHGSDSRTAPR